MVGIKKDGKSGTRKSMRGDMVLWHQTQAEGGKMYVLDFYYSTLKI